MFKEIIFKPQRELHEVKTLKPEKSCFSNKITIRRQTRYYNVTDSAWDIIKQRLIDKYEDKLVETNNGKDILIYEELELPSEKNKDKK